MIETIGELYDALRHVEDDVPVFLDGKTGLGFGSWRGDYADLTIWHGTTVYASSSKVMDSDGVRYRALVDQVSSPEVHDVGELRALMETIAQGVYMQGYKGDTFFVNEWAALWADRYGDAKGKQINEVRVEPDRVEMFTVATDPYNY